jgi:hypothetical protein
VDGALNGLPLLPFALSDLVLRHAESLVFHSPVKMLASQANFTHIEGGSAVAVPASSHPAAPLAGWTTGNEALDLALELRRRRVRQKDLAEHLGVSAAFVCQLLRGAKKAPAGLLERARHFLAGGGG